MNFNKPNTGGLCVVSVHNNQKQQPPPLPSMPPPSTQMNSQSQSSLTPPMQPPPPPPPPLVTSQQNNSSLSSYSCSSASSTSSQASNYLQPKLQQVTNSSQNFNNVSPIYNSSCSFSTNNLNRLKFSNISNQAQNTSSINLYQGGKNSIQQQQKLLSNNYSHHPIASSMRNINELVNSSPKPSSNLSNKEDQNYCNLQQALRAATAALQKSKVSTNILTSQPISKSNINLANHSSNYKQMQRASQMILNGEEHAPTSHSFQPYNNSTGLQQEQNNIHKRVYKNTLNLLIANQNSPPNSSSTTASAVKKSESDYDNIEDNIDISVDLNHQRNNNNSKFLSVKSSDEISLLDETAAVNQQHKTSSNKFSQHSTENETISSFSSPSSIASSKSSHSQSSERNSGNATLQKYFMPMNRSNASIFNSKKSAFSSAFNLNEKKSSDYFNGTNLNDNNNNNNTSQNDIYREIAVDCGDDETEVNIASDLKPNILFYPKSHLTSTTKHKSASIDQLNLASSFSTKSHHYANLHNKKTTTINDEFRDHSDQEKLNQQQTKSNNPPPNIQPYSGVLSKSLHSLVLRPQPLKPIVEQTPATSVSNVTVIKPLVGNTGGSCFSNQQYSQFKANNEKTSKTFNAFREKLIKSKCASTTNLFNDSSSFQTINIKPKLGAKSVNFLSSKHSESDDSLETDHDDDDEDDASSSSTSENYGQFEILVDNNKVTRLESNLSDKSQEIVQLRSQLQQTIENNSTTMRQRDQSILDLECEKKLYEKKLKDMRAHYTDQLTMFEQNERKIMQERISCLQSMHNELKMNFQKNLDGDLKDIRAKLAESQNYSAQLLNELNKCTCHRTDKETNSITQSTTTQTDCPETDLNVSNYEVLKRSKLENNQLKFQLEQERRQFQAEREKWLTEKQKVLQFQNYLQQQRDMSDSQSSINSLNTSKRQNSHSLSSKKSLPQEDNTSQVQAKKTLASHMQFLQQKLSLQQKQQDSTHQLQNSKKNYFRSQQSNPSKLFAQSLLASSTGNTLKSSSQSHRVKPQNLLMNQQNFL